MGRAARLGGRGGEEGELTSVRASEVPASREVLAVSSDAVLPAAGRVVMVSGANRGIGLAVARRLHADGYTLSLGARNVAALARAVGSLGGERVLCCRYDADDRASASAWVDATVARFGRIDALVNNAGILRRFPPDQPDEAALDDMWTVNVKAPYRLTAAALPLLRKTGSGRIVNVVSTVGLRYKGGVPGYALTKFAAMALTHVIRYAGWNDGVRVTALCPGETRTDMTAGIVATGHPATEPETLAAIVSLVIALPNEASVAALPINCVLESTV